MVSLNPPVCDFGTKAIDFDIVGTDSEFWNLERCMGENGLLVMFISNHCPYVKAIQQRIMRDTRELYSLGIAAVAISSNDVTEYPEDSFLHMQNLALQLHFDFPYLFDESQEVAKKYGAVCTPDFFGYNKDFELQYRGRLDESRKEAAPSGVKRDLFEAMKEIAETGQGPKEQFPSMGCSIKWKNETKEHA
jgi:peroxiredoxin